MKINFNDLNPIQRYKVMSQTVTPRPIAWIVTEDEGIINIAPFSYFIPLSSEPPTFIVSIGHKKDGTPKDTLHNIRLHKQATICLVQENHLEKMHLSSTALEKHESEIEHFDIPAKKMLESFPPLVEGSQCTYFCSLHQEIHLEGSKTIPLIMEVQHCFIDDSVCDPEFNITLQNVGRIGREYLLGGMIKTLS